MSNRNLDDWVRKSLEGVETAPSKGVWEEISSQIGAGAVGGSAGAGASSGFAGLSAAAWVGISIIGALATLGVWQATKERSQVAETVMEKPAPQELVAEDVVLAEQPIAEEVLEEPKAETYFDEKISTIESIDQKIEQDATLKEVLVETIPTEISDLSTTSNDTSTESLEEEIQNDIQNSQVLIPLAVNNEAPDEEVVETSADNQCSYTVIDRNGMTIALASTDRNTTWALPDGSLVKAGEVEFTFEKAGPFEIEAYCPSQLGAEIIEGSIYPEPVVMMPNIFTPGSSSAFNDVFEPIPDQTKYVDKYFISIYDGNGNVVWRSTQANQGWNGLLGNNTNAPEGWYLYVVTVYDYDNQSYRTDGRVMIQR